MDMSKKHYFHMTLFWGKDTEILFDGWPATRTGMYVVALITVFAFAFLVEWLNNSRLIGPNWSRVTADLTRTLMHAIRVGLYFLIMLALMSFNVGVVLAIIAGHVVSFFFFGSSVFKQEEDGEVACTPMAS